MHVPSIIIFRLLAASSLSYKRSLPYYSYAHSRNKFYPIKHQH
ncbi:hypothetical protein P20311_0202 [Pseudoalteromonas sp. BSi20311]|nr:hypothetical protein P20311_0202 [Pseudoalteromonas sp. BSi20311]